MEATGDLNVTAGVEVLEAPVKPDIDNKNYRVIRLPNGLTALLISELGPEKVEEHVTKDDADEKNATGDIEEKTSMSAASITVGAGSFHDPEDLKGLAHFLEHMLFMGTEKYPEDNDNNNFKIFIMKNGGYYNATTDKEKTTFYFECQSQHLRKALDMYAQFFIAPLLREESMQRELQAVESEFKLRVPKNVYPKSQLIASLAKKGHPAQNFPTGNLKSLTSGTTTKELKARLHEFHKLHYVATSMTVALQSRHSLDTLQSWVLESFGDVPAGVKRSLTSDLNPFDTPEFTRFYKMNSAEDICQLQFTWAISSLKNQSQIISPYYVEHLLRLSDKSSLNYYLKQNMWAHGLVVWHEGTTIHLMFTLIINLLEEGLNNLQQVIEAVFSYLKMLREKGPSESIIEEIQSILELDFKFRLERTSLAKHVYGLSRQMQDLPPKEYLRKEQVQGQYDLGNISDFLNQLTPDKVNIMLIKKWDANTTFEHTERWYGTPYNVEDFPPEWMTSWLEAPMLDNFELPESNKYLTTDTSLLDCPEGEGPHPRRLTCDERGELWFKQDTTFKVPEMFVYFAFVSPLLNQSPETSVLMDIYLGMLTDQLKPEIDTADAVNLYFFTTDPDRRTGNNITMYLRGYNQNLPLLWEKVVQQMVKFDSEISEKKFFAVKEEQKKYYQNQLIDTNVLQRELQDTLKSTYFSMSDRLNVIDDVTMEQLIKFSRDFRARLYVYGFLQGNVTEQQARDVWGSTRETLAYLPMLDNTWPEHKFIVLQYRLCQPEVGSRVMRISSLNKEISNSVVKHVFYCGRATLNNKFTAKLIRDLMDEKARSTLRTKEQLSYHVVCSYKNHRGVLTFEITVKNQEDKHSVDHVDSRIWEFLRSFQQNLAEVTENELEDLKQTTVNEHLVPARSLHDEATKNWKEICSGEHFFDRKSVSVWEKIKEKTTLEALQFWYERFIINLDTARHISIQVQGHVAPVESQDQGHVTPVESQDQGHVAPVESQDQGHVAPVESQDQGHVAPVESQDQGHVTPVESQDQGHVAPVESQDQGHVPPVESQDQGHVAPVESQDQGHVPPVESQDQGHVPPVESQDQGHVTPVESQVQGHVAPVESQVQGHVAPVESQDQGHVAPVESQVQGHVAPVESQDQGHVAPVESQEQGNVAPVELQDQGHVTPVESQDQGHVAPVESPLETTPESSNEPKSEDQVDSNTSQNGVIRCGPSTLQLLVVEGSTSKPITDLEEYKQSLFLYPMYHKTSW